MKTIQAINPILIIAGLFCLFSAETVAANEQRTINAGMEKIQISTDKATHQVVYLQAELAKITLQSGIKFQISTDITYDKVTPTVQTENLQATVRTLLHNYNWVAIQDGNFLKTVIITGKKGDYLAPDAGPADEQIDETPSGQGHTFKTIIDENRLDVANGHKIVLEQYEFSGD